MKVNIKGVMKAYCPEAFAVDLGTECHIFNDKSLVTVYSWNEMVGIRTAMRGHTMLTFEYDGSYYGDYLDREQGEAFIKWVDNKELEVERL